MFTRLYHYVPAINTKDLCVNNGLYTVFRALIVKDLNLHGKLSIRRVKPLLSFHRVDDYPVYVQIPKTTIL